MSAVRLIQFTDPHLYGGADEALRGVATLPALRSALAAAQAQDWPPQAVLLTGDLVQDDPAGYAHFRPLFGNLGVPVLCLPGNHDEPEAMRRVLTGAPFVLDDHYDLGRWRIVLLDSSLAGSASGTLAAASLQSLAQSLSSAGNRHCLVCLHHHPVPMESRWLDRVGLTNASQFFATLDRFNNVRGVLFGHVHQPHDSLRRGVRLLGTPSTCAQFLPHSDDFAIDSRPPAWRSLELHNDGAIVTEVLWVDPRRAGASHRATSAA